MVALALMAIPLLLPSSKPVELVTERKVNARTISKSEVAQHKREGDCWVSMEGKVYDISNYVEEHPGGETAILKYAGRDVSVPFRGPQHGSQVDDVIANYYIGTLE